MSVMVATQTSDGFFLSTASSFIPRRNPEGVTDWGTGHQEREISHVLGQATETPLINSSDPKKPNTLQWLKRFADRISMSSGNDCYYYLKKANVAQKPAFSVVPPPLQTPSWDTLQWFTEDNGHYTSCSTGGKVRRLFKEMKWLGRKQGRAGPWSHWSQCSLQPTSPWALCHPSNSKWDGGFHGNWG